MQFGNIFNLLQNEERIIYIFVNEKCIKSPSKLKSLKLVKESKYIHEAQVGPKK